MIRGGKYGIVFSCKDATLSFGDPLFSKSECLQPGCGFRRRTAHGWIVLCDAEVHFGHALVHRYAKEMECARNYDWGDHGAPSMRLFDDTYIAPMMGCSGGAAQYYRAAASGPLLHRIRFVDNTGHSFRCSTALIAGRGLLSL